MLSDIEGERNDITNDVVLNIVDEKIHDGDQVVDQKEADITKIKSGRVINPSTNYLKFTYMIPSLTGKPEDLSEVVDHNEKDKWVNNMRDELKSLHENKTKKLVNHLPKGRKAFKNKWVF